MVDRNPGNPEPEGTPPHPSGAPPEGSSGAGFHLVAGGLRELGRVLAVTDPPADLAATVLARVADDPAPRPSWWRRAWDRVVVRAGQARRIVVVAVVVALLALAVGTPASARIAEWLGLGAVVVVRTPGPPATPDGNTPPDQNTAPGQDGVPGQGGAGDPAGSGMDAVELSLPDARARVPFALGIPVALGDPDRVLLAADGRVVTMTWTDRPGLSLDQLSGEPNPYVVKRYSGNIEFVSFAGASGFWLPEPHPLQYVDPTGADRFEPARTSGPSLIWQRGGVTLRLEGEPDLAAALAVAESVR